MATDLKATILGCGSSSGVPRIGNDWGNCDPNNPKNRRRRCSLLLQSGACNVLIDTAPDMREQMLDADVGHLDAVFFTHSHADQAHGIDDLRAFFLRGRKKVDTYMDSPCRLEIMRRFDYCFQEVMGYPAILNACDLGDEPVTVSAVTHPSDQLQITPLPVIHGNISSLGFRCGDLAYIPDVSDIPDATFDKLQGLEVFIIDALRYNPHPSHAHLEKSLEWIERLKPGRAILTNMHIDLDYDTLVAELPEGVEPAWDGMEVQPSNN